MNEQESQIQVSVELVRGYRDVDGNVHKTVVLRPPLIDDEIKRDGELATIAFSDDPVKAGEAESQLYATLLLIRQVTVQFGSMIKPPFPLAAFRSLSRRDVRLLVAGFNEVEARMEALYVEPEGNDDGDGEDNKTESSNV